MRYRTVRQILGVLVCEVLFLLAGAQPAHAAGSPFRAVVDGLTPAPPGLTITGMTGGCDFVIDNASGQELLLFDQASPPQALHYPATPKGSPPVVAHLQGKWPCASLPAVTEEEQWNHVTTTVRVWALQGQLGTVAFQLRGRTLYDPALDVVSEGMYYFRIGAGALAAAGVVLGIPYLLARRRLILTRTS